MSVEELERAVADLPPDKLAKFRAWYEAFDADLWDAKIERDASNGTLDRVFEKSEQDFREGRFREL
jgi:hypothetical protein